MTAGVYRSLGRLFDLILHMCTGRGEGAGIIQSSLPMSSVSWNIPDAALGSYFPLIFSECNAYLGKSPEELTFAVSGRCPMLVTVSSVPGPSCLHAWLVVALFCLPYCT